MNFRAFRRAVALGFVVSRSIFNYWLLRMRGRLSLEQRARWLHVSSRKALAALNVEVHTHGHPPTRGLLVSNHLSYLDIVVFAAATPCFFVSKAEIARWPIFGPAARACGTIFLVRSSRESADEAAGEIGERLTVPVPVLLFPEGTSSDGSAVLPFHSRLIDPAIVRSAPVTPAAVRYVVQGDLKESDLCWFDDTVFLPHLLKTLGAQSFRAELRFGEPRLYHDRRAATRQAHAEVVAMRVQGALEMLHGDRKAVHRG